MDNIRLDRETVVVTGGTDGIGKAIARRLVIAGADVFIVGRDADKGKRAANELGGATGHERVHFMQADLSLMRDTERLAHGIKARISRLHRLVLCAGVVRGRRLLTAEGFESNFATNYLSRFVLTEQLLPLLAAAGRPRAAARIVVIGGAAMNGRIRYDDINLNKNFGILTAVLQFCQANDLFVIEQARRLAEAGARAPVSITTLKVGVVRTNIRREFPWWMKLLVAVVFDPLLAQTPDQIAASAWRLLADPAYEGKSGLLFRQVRRFRTIESGARTRDAREGRRFWAYSSRLAAQARGQLIDRRDGSGAVL
jgi:NAD(P)-dependent dehydrogenase (short-subunit alcohol dehydrogenase family)